MAQIFTFNGASRRILLGNTEEFSAQDLYSRWKEWVQTSDNSKYEIAFRSVAGDPVSQTQNVAPYFFLNTIAGWRIQPYESDHELRIDGNLYSEDPSLGMFVLPSVVGQDVAVNIIINRSVNALAVSSPLTVEQATWLKELWQLRGLDPTNPLVATSTTRRVPSDGSLIDQTIVEGGGSVTVQRT